METDIEIPDLSGVLSVKKIFRVSDSNGRKNSVLLLYSYIVNNSELVISSVLEGLPLPNMARW